VNKAEMTAISTTPIALHRSQHQRIVLLKGIKKENNSFQFIVYRKQSLHSNESDTIMFTYYIFCLLRKHLQLLFK